MGAAASLAERHVEADISLADAKALVPPGAWDDRWDGQFGAAAASFASRSTIFDAANASGAASRGLAGTPSAAT